MNVSTSLANLALVAEATPKKIASVEGNTEYRLHNGLRVLLFPNSLEQGPSQPSF
jgi:hypothetical protein